MLRQLVSLFVALCIGFAPQLSFGVVRSNGVNTGNVGITGGTITGTPAVYTPTGGVSAIPFIHLSSGTIAVGGGISAITALPLIYPSAYCWFPANALATAIAAGWYYCTFSSTTAGTAFLNTYTSGAPTIPAAPTAVTDGKGAFVSDTAAHNGPTISIAASSMGLNGQLRIQSDWQFTNSAGTKTPGITFGGATVLSNAGSTQVSNAWAHTIANQGVAGKQVTRGAVVLGSNTVAAGAPTLLTVDTSTAQNLILSLLKNTAADNLILERYSIETLFSN